MADDKKFSVDPELLNEFIAESEEFLSEIEDLFVSLESDPDNTDIIGSIFRPIHSIKGNSAFFGLMDVQKLAHSMEDVLDLLRKEIRKTDKPVIDLLLAGTDMLGSMMKSVRGGSYEHPDKKALSVLLERLEDYKNGNPLEKLFIKMRDGLSKAAVISEQNGQTEIKEIIQELIGEISREEHDQKPVRESLENESINHENDFFAVLDKIASINDWSDIESESFRRELKDEINELIKKFPSGEARKILEALEEDTSVVLDSIGPDPILADIIEGALVKLREYALPSGNVEESDVKKQNAASVRSMRVAEESIDHFLTYVGELVVVGEMFGHIYKKLYSLDKENKIQGEFRQTYDLFSGLSQKLQKSIMSIRKVPVKSLLHKAPRIVRDIASKTNKRIKVSLVGENIQVDKSLIETLEAPLTHLVRNAADHGIEPAQEREDFGKNPEGLIKITVSEDKDSIILAVSDDGKGIPLDKIKKKGIEKGIIQDGTEPGEEEIMNVLFASGVSTAEKITDVSGRGVGMDVVKTEIEKRGGKITVSTEKENGSVFTVILPNSVTTQILDGFVIRLNGQFFVIPMDKIQESFKLEREMVRTIENRGECVIRHEEVLPLFRLSKIFGYEYDSSAEKAAAITVLTKHGKAALCVDSIVGVQQVVLKNVDGLKIDKDFFLGGAVMGDGSVAMVIELEKLFGEGMLNTVSENII
ncbi:MAG: chemotaxis protein CheA [Fibrobacterota bacterium]